MIKNKVIYSYNTLVAKITEYLKNLSLLEKVE